jgi:hypothetical protein
MRRSLVLLAAGFIAAAGGIGIAVQAANAGPVQPTPPPVGSPQQRYGIVRYDIAAHRWTILSTPVFQASGLTGVMCTATGTLVVGFDPLTTIGTFMVDEDESYAGRYDAGASVGTDTMTITVRRPSTGTAVPCGAPELRIANSNFQVLIVGSEAAPTTVPTTQPPTTRPTPSTPPTSDPSPSAPPTSTPPIIIG